MATCYMCKLACVLKEDKNELFGCHCDICRRIVCSDCSGIKASEIRVIPLKTRVLLFACSSCILGFQELPKLLAMEDRIKRIELSMSAMKPQEMPAQPIEKSSVNLDQQTLISSDCVAESSILKSVKDALDDQTALIGEKLGVVVKNITDTNKELVEMLSSGVCKVSKSVDDNSDMGNQDSSILNDRKRQKSAKICTGPEKPTLKIANKNIGERIAKLEWIYLANLDVNTTADDIVAVLNPEYLHLYRCEKLTSKFKEPRSAAFKLGVPEGLKAQYLSTDFWPDGCYVNSYNLNSGSNNGSKRSSDQNGGPSNGNFMSRRRPYSRRK